MRVPHQKSDDDDGIPLIQEAVRFAVEDKRWEMVPANDDVGRGFTSCAVDLKTLSSALRERARWPLHDVSAARSPGRSGF
jgi:hypothetical protein